MVRSPQVVTLVFVMGCISSPWRGIGAHCWRGLSWYIEGTRGVCLPPVTWLGLPGGGWEVPYVGMPLRRNGRDGWGTFVSSQSQMQHLSLQTHKGRQRKREKEQEAWYDQRMTGKLEEERVDQNKGSFWGSPVQDSIQADREGETWTPPPNQRSYLPMDRSRTTNEPNLTN